MKGHPVLLIEASPLVRMALTSVLHRLGLSVITATHGHLEAAKTRQLLLVLFDVATFSGGLNELVETVKTSSRSTPVLLLGREDRLEEILAGLKAGASGVIWQTASEREMRAAVKALTAGQTYCEPTVFRKVMQLLPAFTFEKKICLTKREEQVLRHLTLGRSNKEIAHDLSLSEQSVKVHVSNLFRKTGTSNRSNLAVFAITEGISGQKP